MTQPVDVWTGRNDIRKSTEMSEFGPEMSEFRQEKIWTKDIFSIKIWPKFGFSLDVISLLFSQFDLQNKKYCIGLHLVVAQLSYWFGRCIREWCICPGQYILLLVYQTQALIKLS